VAVDTLPSAGDSRTDYRPQENPAKRYITDGAVDAVGTLRRLLRTLLSSFATSLATRTPFKAALNVFVAEERASEDLGT
jgi:hypothetical protein